MEMVRGEVISDFKVSSDFKELINCISLDGSGVDCGKRPGQFCSESPCQSIKASNLAGLSSPRTSFLGGSGGLSPRKVLKIRSP